MQLIFLRWSPCGEVANGQDCDIVEVSSNYNCAIMFTSRIITLWEILASTNPPSYKFNGNNTLLLEE